MTEPLATHRPVHYSLPTQAQAVTTTTYTVGCSCGWRYQDAIEEWAEKMLQRHQEEEAWWAEKLREKG